MRAATAHEDGQQHMGIQGISATAPSIIGASSGGKTRAEMKGYGMAGGFAAGAGAGWLVMKAPLLSSAPQAAKYGVMGVLGLGAAIGGLALMASILD